MKRRMSYRIPEKKFKKVKEKLDNMGIEFEEFVDKTIDLYLSGELNPKEDVEDWGNWMEKKQSDLYLRGKTNMRMKRGICKIEKDKHRQLMKKFISDNMSFNEFLDRTFYMYLKDKYTINEDQSYIYFKMAFSVLNQTKLYIHVRRQISVSFF